MASGPWGRAEGEVAVRPPRNLVSLLQASMPSWPYFDFPGIPVEEYKENRYRARADYTPTPWAVIGILDQSLGCLK